MSAFRRAIHAGILSAALLFALSGPGVACDNGFFVISCGNLGAPGSCVLGSYDGVDEGFSAYNILDSCIDCESANGYIWSYAGTLDCDGDPEPFSGWGCYGCLLTLDATRFPAAGGGWLFTSHIPKAGVRTQSRLLPNAPSAAVHSLPMN